ncbi:MAG: prephenate dehydrogenase [Bacteroidota bacterium]
MVITIVGIGLIGGSLAKDVRANGLATKLIGVDAIPAHGEDALRLGLVDEMWGLEMACKIADLVVLAVPVGALIKLMPEVLDMVGEGTVVVDMGSTKQEISEAISKHPKRAQAVLAHPMAGTEYSGPQAAVNNLFQGKAAIICEREKSDPEALKLAERLFKSLFMRLLYMDSKAHDIHAAYVSHISHISSFVLALTVLEKEKSEAAIFDLASGGFASTVRLAKSSPRMWRDVYEQNAENILDVLDSYLEKMHEFRNHIAQDRFDETFDLMQEANAIKRILA